MTAWTDDEGGGTVWSDDEVGASDGTLTGAQIDVDADKVRVIDATDNRPKLITVEELVANTSSFTQSGSGASARSVQAKLREVQVSVMDFGATGDGSTDDTSAIQKAIDTGKDVYFPKPSSGYKITSVLTVSTAGQRIFGGNKGSQSGSNIKITSASDIEFFKVTGDYVVIEGLLLDCTLTSHSKRHIQSYDADHLQVINCRINGASGSGVGGGIGFGNGAGAVGGSMGLVDRCIISHGSIDVFTSDVKISNSYIWANSKPYGVKVIASVGNVQMIGCDFLPPVSTVTGKKAGIYLTGACTNCKIVGCQIDGNTSLNVGVGILAENGVVGLVIDGLTADNCDDNVVVFDSCVAPKIVNSTFTNNNRQGSASVCDILLQDNFTQDMDRCIVSNNTHIMTAAVPTGSAGPAIKVDTTGGRRGLMITNNLISQPGAGGGYTDQEIELADGAFASCAAGSLAGNRGTRRTAVVSGTATIPVDDTFETVSYGATLYYAPRIDQINLSFQGSAVTIADHRINHSASPGTTSVGIGFAASHPEFTLGFLINLV